MDQDEALAGDYVGVMLAIIAVWIALVAGGITVAAYLAMTRL